MQTNEQSAAAKALEVVGDYAQAQDVGAIDAAMAGVQEKLKTTQKSLVQRLIYGPSPSLQELQAGGEMMQNSHTKQAEEILHDALESLNNGKAFLANGKLSSAIRSAVASKKAYGFTIPVEYGGLGLNYNQLAILEESLVANGIGALAVELSGQLTIGGSSLLGYGTPKQQSLFLPMISSGDLIAFGLTEVGTGVNAKKIQAYVERDEQNSCFRLFAEGAANKLYITNAIHGGHLGIAARIGKEGKKIGLFLLELPKENVDNGEYSFSIASSNADAFTEIENNRLSFSNFPIPLDNQIQGDGVEVLFYCLRMGRCMLTSMCAGYQKMLASDAIFYAKQRLGVGGLVIKHELPRLGIGKILGGSLASQALAHLALAQDAQGVDLAGLRDISKSFGASSTLASLIACERVVGGRSFDKDSRITKARANIHVFGIVEGEDDLIRMSMVKDITSDFTGKYMLGMLSVLQNANKDTKDKILKLSAKTFLKHPLRATAALTKLLFSASLWKLGSWLVYNVAVDTIKLPARLIPLAWRNEYKSVPSQLREYIDFAQRNLRKARYIYFGISVFYQLEQTHAQIPLQRFGKYIELLVAMLCMCTHACKMDKSAQQIAALQSEILKNEIRGIFILRSILSTEKLRKHLKTTMNGVDNGENTFINDIKPQPFAHNWAK